MNDNRFQDFFETGDYVALKNHLYNYLLRKRAISNAMADEPPGLALEVGSGISPVLVDRDNIVYSDLSFLACQSLKRMCPRGLCVVADATRLPFKDGAFANTISSEVLEHVPDDRGALAELARVMKPEGRMVVTFPHRKCYFTIDDAYIKHLRRYELSEIQALLTQLGMQPLVVTKVLGPLEKVTMMAAVLMFQGLQRFRKTPKSGSPPTQFVRIAAPFFKYANWVYAGIIWADAQVVPRPLAACLLIKAEKIPAGK